MATISLLATTRDPKAKAKVLRRIGIVPAVVYGHNIKNMLVQCAERDMRKALVQAGESTLVELDVEGKKIPVLFKNVDFHPVSDREIHADFYAVNMNEEIEAQVPVHFSGESLAIKALGGVLVTVHDHIRVRCLPAKLPRNIEVDISSLANLHDHITLSQLSIPEGVKVMDKPETVICLIQEPRAVEVVEPVPGAAAATDAAAVPGAEGAPAAAAGAPGAEAAAKEGADKKEAPKK